MTTHLIQDTTLSSIADAIRAKAGKSEAFTPAQMVSEIENLPTGGGGDTDALIKRTLSGTYENSTVDYIGSYAFRNCSSLTSVNLPLAIMIDSYAFGYCGSLTSVNLPLATTLESYAFGNCSSLTLVNLPLATWIGSYAFTKCYNLLSLYLTNSSICSLPYSNAFSSTPIAGYITSTRGIYGSIYVPASLFDSYKTAKNWSVFSSRFVSI